MVDGAPGERGRGARVCLYRRGRIVGSFGLDFEDMVGRYRRVRVGRSRVEGVKRGKKERSGAERRKGWREGAGQRAAISP